VGGGGLISGVASALKSVSRDIQVVGCQPAASDVMRQSVAARHIVDVPSAGTLSDGRGCRRGGNHLWPVRHTRG